MKLYQVKDLPPRFWRVANTVAIIALLYFILYYLTAFRFDVLFTAIERQVDFKQWYAFPRILLEHLKYPSVVINDWTIPYPYLPSANVLFLPLSWLPRPVAFGLWIMLQAASLITILWAGLKLAGALQSPGRLLIAAGAVLMADNQVAWDFRTHNTNVIYLALIMLGLVARPTWLKGLLFAVSVNLKIYSSILAAGFLWRREYRVAVAMIVASAIIGIALPVAVFGAYGFGQLMAGWLDQAFFSPPPGVRALLPPDLFRRSAAVLAGANQISDAVTLLLRAGQAVWLAVIVGYFVVAGRRSPTGASDQARLADVCVLLLVPLPLSIWFVPYQAVVLLPAYILLLTAAADDGRPRWVRTTAIVAMATSQILQYAIGQWELRGATSLVSFIFIVIAIGVARRQPSAQTAGKRDPALAAASGH